MRNYPTENAPCDDLNPGSKIFSFMQHIQLIAKQKLPDTEDGALENYEKQWWYWYWKMT